MTDEIKQKRKYLQKYVPFIDYIINNDSGKCDKFKKIKTWVVGNQRLGLNDLNKIEQSIIASYNNFIVEDKKIPMEIATVFMKEVQHEVVNLCSDDEEDDCNPNASKEEQIKSGLSFSKHSTPISKSRNDSKDTRQMQRDTDDDIETVSISSVHNSKREILRQKSSDISQPLPKKEFKQQNTTDGSSQLVSENVDELDVETARLLERINEIKCEDLKNQYHAGKTSSNEEILFQRRPGRKGCSVPEAAKEQDKNVSKVLDIISLDSSDDSDDDGNQNVGTDHAMYKFKHSPRAETNLQSERIPTIDNQRLKALSRLIQLDLNRPTDLSSPGEDRNLPSLPCSVSSEQSASSTPPAPRIKESSEKIEKLMKAFVEFLEKVKPASEITGETSNSSAVPLSNLPCPPPVPQFQNFNYPHPNQPQHVNFYISPTMQNANYNPQHTGNTSQAMHPNEYIPYQQQATASHTPAVPQFVTPQQQTSLNPRDPRVNSSAYQRSLRIAEGEISKRQAPQMTTNYTNQPNVSAIPVAPMSNNFISSSHTSLGAPRPSQSQYRRMSETRDSENQPSTSTKSSITYGDYKRRQSEQINNKREHETRHTQAFEVRKNEDESNLVEGVTSARNHHKGNLVHETRGREKNELDKPAPAKVDTKKNNAGGKIVGRTRAEKILENANKDERSSDKVEKSRDEASKTEKEKSGHKKRQHKNSARSDNTNESDSGRSNVQSKRSSIETDVDEYSLPQNSSLEDESLRIEKRMDRMNKKMKCTLKGFEQLSNTTARPIGKRRSSIHAREAISNQLSNSADNKENRNGNSAFDEPKKKRRASMYCMSAEFLTSQSVSKSQQPKKGGHKNTKVVPAQKSVKPKNVLNVHLIESGMRTQSVNCGTEASSPAARKPCLKILNNDCQMTERNTKLCALCNSKPLNLTNHYKQKHKSESYVSRLSWSELDNLCMNAPFALEVKSSPNTRYKQFEVLCPFCVEKIAMPFKDLYNHYASHTGEYAFQCESCKLEKPFKADIQSHQLHRKTCRNSQIQVMYRYPPNTMSIYLYYCKICNFVQLNQGSILKHLSEHHNAQKTTTEYLQKCILAAISIGTEANPSPEKQKPNNTVTHPNETVDKHSDNKETEETATLPKDQMERKTKENAPNPEPRTIVHFESQSMTCGENVLNKAPLRHVPKVFKSEAIDFDENFQLTPVNTYTVSTKAFTKYVASCTDYRQYPANVNYLGFYKCMADDCFYSSDAPEQFVAHIEGHREKNIPENYLLCPYCNISVECYESVAKLIAHLQMAHARLVYQCSMCCYRSCEALYVLTHQKEKHLLHLDTCGIYKCPGREVSFGLDYFKENMAESVTKVKCSRCSDYFYSTHMLMLHMNARHNIKGQEIMRRYSCVYCTFWDERKNNLKIHIAMYHPGELPFFCDHNSPNMTEDSLHNLELVNFSEPVPITEASSTFDPLPLDTPAQENSDTNIDKDIKPTVEGLIAFQTENVVVRLRKLTERTGVAPDSLYRCAEESCGGFFSIYELWLRHMRAKHKCCEAQCPHCCNETIKPLQEFGMHFESHRRHTFICFHCPLTAANDDEAQMHWLQEHSDLGPMHVQKIRMNWNYSYSILVQSSQSHTEFISSLNALLEKRIKELEDIEASKFLHEWLVRKDSSSQWLENFPIHTLYSKPLKKCFSRDCQFRTICDEELYRHVRSNHVVSGSVFKCSTCDIRIENATSWDDILHHIKQHSETSFFVCCACSNYFLLRTKITEHIRSEHASRDVPIVNLFRKPNQTIYAKIGIVFANERLTFSTMRNCFCCKERGLNGHALMLHLKRFHNFVLDYFCEWCNMPIDSLLAAQEHFRNRHTTNKLKIRCEIAAKTNLDILSVHELDIRISSGENLQDIVVVKQEQHDADDSVIIMEDEDIIAEVHETQIEENTEKLKPKIKCIALDNLMDPQMRDNTGSSNVAQLRILPRIKIVSKRPMEPPQNAYQSTQKFQTP